MELALQLCWAIGEHGGGGASHKDAARELFENLELLLYENLSSRYEFQYLWLSELMEMFFVIIAMCLLTIIFAYLESRLGLRQEATVGSNSENYRKSSQSRLLCFVLTAIAKLATYHHELLPRARVSLGKVCLLV